MFEVLILVLVEHTLGVNINKLWVIYYIVLILVLVEHTLGEIDGETVKDFEGNDKRLNPCFSGTYSRRATFTTYTISKYYAC